MNTPPTHACTPEGREQLLNFVRRVRPPARIASFPSPADLEEMLSVADICSNTWLWLEGDGTVAAYAILDPACASLVFEARPGRGHSSLEEAALAWGIARAGKLDLPEELETACPVEDRARVRRLKLTGFVELPETSLHYERSLAGSLPLSPLPPGFTIRPLAGEAEMAVLVALHRAAWGSDQMTADLRRAIMAAPSYLPDGDLVVVDPHGQLAGYCTCWISAEENVLSGRLVGYTDPIGVQPAYSRQGLASALLSAGFHFLKGRGMQTAALGTSSENLPARATFEAAGFVLVSSTARFKLSSRAGQLQHHHRHR